MAIKTAPRELQNAMAEGLRPRVPGSTFGKGFVPPPNQLVGRPRSGKQVVSLRLDPDVIEKYRATGPGWQARINEILRDHSIP
jgi:uncharacterized protein (DUF4415 family)